MKEYDYKAIPYKERLTTLCGIALNQYNVIHIDIQQFVSKYPVIKDMVARLTKELLFDVKMEMPDVTLFDETDKEGRQEFLNSIQGQEFQNVNNAIHRSDKLLQLTLAQNAEKVAEMLQEVHSDNCSVIQYNDENSLACVLSLAYYSAQDSYAIYRELQGGEGFADLVFVPRTGNHNPAMIVELKWNQTTGIALEQIKDRNYIRCLKDYHGKVLFVGVNYDKKSKKHTCQFEMMEI